MVAKPVCPRAALAVPARPNEASTRAVQAPRPGGRAASARTAAPEKDGNGALRVAPRPEETSNGGRRKRGAGRATAEAPGAALDGLLRSLLRGLRAGDLECVLLTVAMAADENRMPCGDPDEAARILAFLARLAGHDAALPPPPPDGAGVRPEEPVDAG